MPYRDTGWDPPCKKDAFTPVPKHFPKLQLGALGWGGLHSLQLPITSLRGTENSPFLGSRTQHSDSALRVEVLKLRHKFQLLKMPKF